MYHEIKSLLQNDTVFYSLVIVLVAVLSFGLGRLSVENEAPQTSLFRPVGSTAAPVAPTIPAPKSTATTSAAAPSAPPAQSAYTAGAAAITTATTVIASKSGTKYHAPWCPGAKQIKEANRISFATPLEARASGYTPAANCPGLE